MSGSDPTALVGAVENVRDRFEYGRGNVETGVDDVDSTAVAQLRKPCRPLAAARTLREVNGYHTAVVELSVG